MLMAMPPCLLGLLPTHDEIGVAAPLLLTLLRVLQGLSVGGEFAGSMAFLVEYAPAGRRGYAGSWSEFSAQMGILLSSGTSAILAATLSHEALCAWGWRVPFLLGVLVALVAVYMRTSIEESPEFERLKKTETVPRFPLLEVLRHRRAELWRRWWESSCSTPRRSTWCSSISSRTSCGCWPIRCSPCWNGRPSPRFSSLN